MTTTISDLLTGFFGKPLRCAQLLALLLLATFVSVTPAHAQTFSNGDTWKSVAIIGGSTAAGAFIGHQVAGRTGAYVGAAAGATAGYAIDRRRRQNQYNNGYYGNNGYYNNGYYGDSGGYNGNAPYNGPGSQYPYGSGYQSSSYNRNNNRCSSRR